MSTENTIETSLEIPCPICGRKPQIEGDFNDYRQCRGEGCAQRAFAIHHSVWPKILTPEEMGAAEANSEI